MQKLTLLLSVSISIFFAISVQAQVTQNQARNYQIDETHSGAVSVPDLLPPLKQKWSVTFGQDMSYPLIVDGKVFVTVRHASVYGTTLYALNAADGSTVWSYELGGSDYWSALCYENGRVFAINHSGLLRAFDGVTGSLIWSRQLVPGYAFDAPPTVFQGVVYISGGGSGGTVFAVSADTGDILWTKAVADGSHSSPAVTSEGVYLSYACPNIYKLNPADGAQIWKTSYACTGTSKTPVLYQGRLYVRQLYDGDILDSATGGSIGGFIVSYAHDEGPPVFSGNMGFFMNFVQHASPYANLERRDLNGNILYWSFF